LQNLISFNIASIFRSNVILCQNLPKFTGLAVEEAVLFIRIHQKRMSSIPQTPQTNPQNTHRKQQKHSKKSLDNAEFRSKTTLLIIFAPKFSTLRRAPGLMYFYSKKREFASSAGSWVHKLLTIKSYVKLYEISAAFLWQFNENKIFSQ
jgi:hypothetical protein